MNLKRFLSHNTLLVKQNLKDWKIINIVSFMFNVEIVFIKKKKKKKIDYGSCNCEHHSLNEAVFPKCKQSGHWPKAQ